MKVTVKKLTDLHVMEKNIRRHTDKQLKEYVRSIEMFGQFKPLVVDENGTILAGNGLFYALQSMGRETCDCYVMTGLTENQKKKLMLADNRVYELGFTDTSIFDEIIHELGGDVDVPGWDAELLEVLNASVREATEMVENYGVYEPHEVEAVNSKERLPDAPAAHTASEPVSQPTQADDMPHAEAQRVIVCPKCGEKICL